MSKLTTLRNNLEKARDALENEIYSEMERIANKKGIELMMFTHYGNHYEKNGKVMECREIDELDNLFQKTIHPGGFEGIWRKERGWS